MAGLDTFCHWAFQSRVCLVRGMLLFVIDALIVT